MRWPWSARREEELRREIRDHLDLEAEEREEAGATPDAARREARLAFGNPDAVIEDVREAWGWGWLDRLMQDARFACRLWLQSPGFSIVAVLTIALGIGATTALVGQVNAVFWTPLPVEQPSDLRLLTWTSPRRPFVIGPNVLPGPATAGGETFASFSFPAYEAMRDESRAFSDLACWADLGEARPVILGELGFGAVQFVSGNYFRTLGVRAAIGRTIQPDDDQPGGFARVAMISHRFWQRAFGSAADVTRQTMRLNGQTFSIVGVTPEGFFGMDPSVSPDVIAPIRAVQIAAATPNSLAQTGFWNVCRVVGRRAPGTTDLQASAELETVLREHIARTPPDRPYDPPRIQLLNGGRGLETLRAAASAPLTVLVAVVGGLLLAACANIAGLLLTRGRSRAKEIATRLALGAPASRIVRQLVTESLVLSLAGGALGLGFAYALSAAGPVLLSQFMPTLFGADRTVSVATTPDARVLLFGTCVSLAAGLLFGVMPALQATRVDLVAMLKETVSGAGERGVRLIGGQLMIGAQAALAILLLVGAGLFLRTVINLRNANLGFEPGGLVYARVEPRAGGLSSDQRGQFFEDAIKRLQSLPGAQFSSAAAVPVLGGSASVGADTVPFCTSDSLASGRPQQSAAYNAAAPNYFATMGIPILAGREFTWSDTGPNRQPPIIISKAFAEAQFRGKDPIGQLVMFGAGCTSNDGRSGIPRWSVIGVAGDTPRGLRGEPEPMFYMALRNWGGPITLVVRTAGSPGAMIPTIRKAITELNAQVPTFGEATLTDLRERHLRREQLLLDLLALFATATLLLCSLGIYGMLSYSVSRRRSEISVRMAIGASAADVVLLVVRESLLPVGAGLVFGCLAVLALARWAGGFLYGVPAYDPLTLTVAALAFLMVATVAAAIPARTACRVSPIHALRQR